MKTREGLFDQRFFSEIFIPDKKRGFLPKNDL